ncbi:MAG: leucine-rich repeat domain-containing protein [Clostridia bacterium]
MKKSLLPAIKVFAMLFVAMVLTLVLSSCKKAEEAAPTEVPVTPAPPESTFKPIVEIVYDENEFYIVDTTIVEYIGKGGDVKIPEKVTAIGDMAFSGRSDVTSVEFTKDVVSVGEKAFENCTGLKGVFTPPSNLAHIGDYAFAGCTGITEVELQNKPMTAGTHIFDGCTSLQKVVIPKTMGTIPDYTFYGCRSLTDVTIDNEITAIGKHAFDGCTSLAAFKFPGKTVSAGDYAFKGCTSLSDITFERALENVGRLAFNDTAWFKAQVEKQKTTTPNDTQAADADENKYVMVGHDIIIYYIESSADGSSITLNIPEKAYGIASGAFDHCIGKISAVNFTAGSKLVNLGEGVFQNAVKLSRFDLPSKVTIINDSTFSGCTNLTEFAISSKLTSIGKEAFYNCGKLKSIYLPDDITTIGDAAFQGCKTLTEITLPDNITDLGDYAFKDCENVAKFVIPLKLANVGVQAFDNTKWYTNLSVYEETPVENKFHIYGDGVLIKADIVDNNNIVIPEEVKSIAAFTFTGWGQIKDREFYNSKLPKSITIPNGVTSIGDYAFYFCENLETVFIADSVTNIGEKAFYGCKNLKVINIPDNITEIKDYTFYGCSALSEILLPSNLKTIGSYAFYDCYGLSALDIPATVSSVGEFAFTNTDWFYYNTEKEMIVGDGVLVKITSTSQKVTVSSGVKAIAGGAFETSNVEEITLPASITNLPNYAFSGCTDLAKVNFGGTISSVGSRAFNGCKDLKNISIPAGASIAEDAYVNSGLDR